MSTDITTCLKLFSYMSEWGFPDRPDQEILKELTQCLDDPMVFVTNRGPFTLAALRWFGLAYPFKGQDRLNRIDPELTCKLLVVWEKFKIKISRIENAPQMFEELDFKYK